MEAIWLTIIAVGIATYATRLSFVLLFERLTIPNHLSRALRFVPPAVLTAIVFPEVFSPGGQLDISAGNERLLAGMLAVVVAWRTRSIMVTVVIGMGALWLLQALGL